MDRSRGGSASAVVGALVVSLVVALVVGANFVEAPVPAGAAAPESGPLELVVVSGRPHMVTGGDALVELRGAGTAPVQFSVDGADITPTPAREGQWLVTGLGAGRHRIVARAAGERDALVVTNHDGTGPVFSGPHLPLLACSTEQLGLGPPTDSDCSAPTKVTWTYKSTAGTFVSVEPEQLRTMLFGLMETVTVDGREVPYIVRTEQGVINRSVYWISVIDPSPIAGPDLVGSEFDPAGWNGRLVYRYGGGCGQSFGQGAPLGISSMSDPLLSRGYAVATATFNTFQTQCNDVLSAETTMMVKERFTEQFGRPAFTIGDGGSGGAIQQLLIAQNYPGLLDAIAPSIPFPDAISIAPGVSDCGLLAQYFRTPTGATLTAEQRAAISGYDTWASCSLWIGSFLGGVTPGDGCDPAIAKEEIYDAATNPDGIRCTLADANRNQLGVDRATGFARRPLDNIGVQYGLDALNAGAITPDVFLDLNEHIGGFDVDGAVVAERETARTADVRRAYALGRVLQRSERLRRTPIITTNVYTDAQGDIHTRFRLFSIRERLRASNGTVDRNQPIWTRPSVGSLAAGLTGAIGDSATLSSTLDRWLTTGERPAEAIDTCTGPDGTPVSGPDVDDLADAPGGIGQCNELYPVFGDPRTAAGATMSNDILKCRRKVPRASDYEVTFTDEQLTRLREVFPKGVCDWSRRGFGQVPVRGTWVDYSRPAAPVALGTG